MVTKIRGQWACRRNKRLSTECMRNAREIPGARGTSAAEPREDNKKGGLSGTNPTSVTNIPKHTRRKIARDKSLWIISYNIHSDCVDLSTYYVDNLSNADDLHYAPANRENANI